MYYNMVTTLKEELNMTTVNTLKNNGFEVLTYSDVVEQNKISHTDDDIIYEMNRVGANILLINPYMARYWFLVTKVIC